MTPELVSQIQSVLTSICIVLVGLGAVASLLASVLPPSWRLTQALARFAADLRGIRVPDPGRVAKKPTVALVEDPPKSGPSNPLPPAAALLLLGLVGFGSQACVKMVGPLSPQDLPPGLICVEFLVGDPPVVDAAICAGSAEELALLETRYMAEHPKAVGVRLVRK